MFMGTVFSIEEFSVYDGPGIRTSVFLKGCPLRCSWCHNPEGQRLEPEIVRGPNGCIGCGNCMRTAVEKDGVLALTEESIKKCPMNLIRYSGEEYSAEGLCRKILKNKIILKKGGGVTFSGGEPFMQKDFLLECLSLLKGELHTAIQTCGYTDADTFAKAMELADYFLYDIKLVNDALHRRYTGVSNERIQANFKTLAESGKDFVVRVPLIPGVIDTAENITAIAELISSYGIKYAELLPYNKMAGGKYKLAMREFKPDYDENAESQPREEIFDKYNIKIKIM